MRGLQELMLFRFLYQLHGECQDDQVIPEVGDNDVDSDDDNYTGESAASGFVSLVSRVTKYVLEREAAARTKGDDVLPKARCTRSKAR